MKFKNSPEDFIVEEKIRNALIRKKGPYTLYQIKKKNITTLELVQRIKRNFNIPDNGVSFAGLKDKRSIAYQFITVKDFNGHKIKGRNFIGKRVGNLHRHIRSSDIIRNCFKAILRDIKVNLILEYEKRLKEIKHFGIPNYFDIQRMGHALKGGFFLKNLLLGQEERALKTYLLTLEEFKRPKLRSFKKYVCSNFGKWEKILKKVQEDEEKEVLKTLISRGLRESLKKIPSYKLRLFGEGYQSWIWNRAVIRLLKEKGYSGYRLRHPLNTLFFYRKIKEEHLLMFKRKIYPLPGPDIQRKNGDFIKELKEVVKKEKISGDLDYPEDFSVQLSSPLRSLIIVPESLEWEFRGSNIFLSFSLPRDSYATILFKSLLALENLLSK